jgi:transcriptional regulator with XRE-family HTH domain
MDNNPTPSDLIAERVRKLREDRGMNVRELAARCKAAGMPGLTAQVLYKLEAQRTNPNRPPRPVTVDELLVLAFALDIAPVHLIAGLDDGTPLPVSPEWTVNPAGARNWIRGFVPLSGGDRKRYEANIPASERDTVWFAVPSDYEGAARALEAAQALVSLMKFRAENESGA